MYIWDLRDLHASAEGEWRGAHTLTTITTITILIVLLNYATANYHQYYHY